MGSVYRAVELSTQRQVALKLLRADRAIDGAVRARFVREATTMSRLSSPHTVRVLDCGENDGGELFIAMELLRGESLADRLRRVGRLPVDVAFEAIRQALRSLAEAHDKGIVHRDLKPANLYYAQTAGDPPEELIKVLDFGVAKLLEPGQPSSLTQTLAGTVLGTPCYMSPEQALGRPLDARSDLYSLGVIAYELVTGRPPFIDDTNMLVMARHVRMAPPSLREVAPDLAVAPEVEAALMTMLAKDPARRPASASTMIDLLDRAQASQGSVVSGIRPALAGRLRSALATALGPTGTSPASHPVREIQRTDETVRTRAVGAAGAGWRDLVVAATVAVAATAIAAAMWTTGALARSGSTSALKESNGAVKTVVDSRKR
jgi:serine/threonine-protein kinase